MDTTQPSPPTPNISDPGTRPFSGIRVLDLTRFYAGPFATFQLGLLGADVLKIESLDGDDGRFIATNDEMPDDWARDGLVPEFVALNLNKRSISLNLKDPAAVDVVKRLITDADVVCENFRPGVMERLGLGYETLAGLNPRLVYCAVSGFGNSGPEKMSPSFDGKIQAMSGIMRINGDPDGGPMRVGAPIADLVAGLNGALAITSALHQRNQTGQGQFVDVAMFDSMLNLMADRVAMHTMTGSAEDKQFGNQAVSGRPTGHRFRCGDGFVILAVTTESQFRSLTQVLGVPEILGDPRFVDWTARRANRNDLRDVIEHAMEVGEPLDWERRLNDANVPCGAVRTIADAVEHPQLRDREVIRNVATPHGEFRLVGSGFEMSASTGALTRPAPLLGQHTVEILNEIGCSQQEIEDLLSRGAAKTTDQDPAAAGDTRSTH